MWALAIGTKFFTTSAYLVGSCSYRHLWIIGIICFICPCQPLSAMFGWMLPMLRTSRTVGMKHIKTTKLKSTLLKKTDTIFLIDKFYNQVSIFWLKLNRMLKLAGFQLPLLLKYNIVNFCSSYLRTSELF
jgi:hypothetical protein